ncbi:autophagy-related protein 22 family protein [Skeletonema marinoi]|uniref:Autophagy-related protein 22 family protein n=1 Tax=Skeletonema marinoi TaxID=267567 RepID=A0AAD9D792_9STRA|nr:autophagy-related protein 22 family protein [Skeletonema marinoi]
MTASSNQTTDEAAAQQQPLFLHKPPYGDHLEARGWAFDAIGRSLSFIGNAVFVGTAVVHQAKINAGCLPEDVECTGVTQYGIRPSSFLALYNVIVGLASSALLPLLGAIVDHTSSRLFVARISAISYCILLFPMIFISQATWFAVAVLLIITALIGWIHTGMTFAYLPEMSDDKKTLERLNTSFTVIQFTTNVVYIVVVVGIAAGAGWMDDSLATARLAQSISFVITTAFWGIAWLKLMGPRPAMSQLPPGKHLLTIGFRTIYRTSIDIAKHHRALGWFYGALAFSESATQALLIIITTYSIELLNFSSSEAGVMYLIVLLSSVLGCYLSELSLRLLSPIRSNQLCIVSMALFTALAATFVKDSHALFYMFASFWGVCGGWKYTIERYLAITIIPKNKDAELMGAYLFFGQILSWLPPLVFTALNEAGISIRISMLSLLIFWFIAVICLQVMGPYENALRQANEAVEDSSLVDNNTAEAVEEPESKQSSEAPS